MTNNQTISSKEIILDKSFNAPLFIYGMGRSGTSYLRRLINSLPHVHLLYETKIIRVAYDLFQRMDILSSRNTFQNFLDHLKTLGEERKELFNQPEEFYDSLYKNFLIHNDFSEFCQELFSCLIHPKGTWGNKMIHQDDLRLVMKLFPNARFIIIIRDVRSVVHSLHRTTKDNYYLSSSAWASNARFVKFLQEEARLPHMLFIKYEDVVSQTERIIDEIAAFIGLELGENFSIVEKGNMQTIDKWSSVMSTKEIRKIEEICFEEMKYFGYQPRIANSHKNINKLELCISFLSHLKKLPYRVRHREYRHLFKLKGVTRYFKYYKNSTKI